MKDKFLVEESDEDKEDIWVFRKGDYARAIHVQKVEGLEWHLCMVKLVCVIKNKRQAIKAAKNILKLNELRR